jgi:hypothetical protein
MPYGEPLDTAIRKAKHGHRAWLFWRDRDRQPHIAVSGAESLKAAMLACGTRRAFTLIDGRGTFHRMTWPLAIMHWRNARVGQREG